MEDVNIKEGYCRVCGIKCQTAVKIFSRRGRGMGLQDKILKCFMLSVRKCDQLPTRVCYTCVDRLDDFNQFILLVKQAQTKLRTILKSKGVHVKEEKNSELISTWKALLNLQERETILLGKMRKHKRKSDANLSNSSDSVSSDSSSSDSESSNDNENHKAAAEKDRIIRNETPSASPVKKENREKIFTSKKSSKGSKSNSVSSAVVTSAGSNSAVIHDSNIPVQIPAKTSKISAEKALLTAQDNRPLFQQSLAPASNVNITSTSDSQPIVIPPQMPNSMFLIQGANFNPPNVGMAPLYFLNFPHNTNARVPVISEIGKTHDDASKNGIPILTARQGASTSMTKDVSFVSQPLNFPRTAEQNSSVSTQASIVLANELSSPVCQKPSLHVQPSISQPNVLGPAQVQKYGISEKGLVVQPKKPRMLLQKPTLFVQSCVPPPTQSGQSVLHNNRIPPKSPNLQSKEIKVSRNKKVIVPDQPLNLNSDNLEQSSCMQTGSLHQVGTPVIQEVTNNMNAVETSKHPEITQKSENDGHSDRIASLGVPQTIGEELLSSVTPPPVRFRIIHKGTTSEDRNSSKISSPSMRHRVLPKDSTHEHSPSVTPLPTAISDVLNCEATSTCGDSSSVPTVLDTNSEKQRGAADPEFSEMPPLVVHEDVTLLQNNSKGMASLALRQKGMSKHAILEQSDIHKFRTHSEPSESSDSSQEGYSRSLINDEVQSDSDENVFSPGKVNKSSHCHDLKQSPKCESKKPAVKDTSCSMNVDATMSEREAAQGKSTSASNKWWQNELRIDKVPGSQNHSMMRCALCSAENSPLFCSVMSALDHHKKYHAGKKTLFGCTKCDYISDQLLNVRQHMLTDCSSPTSGDSAKDESLVTKVKEEQSEDYQQALINLKNALRSVSMPRFRKLLTSCKIVLSSTESRGVDIESASKSQDAAALSPSDPMEGKSERDKKLEESKCSFCLKRFFSNIEMKDHVQNCQVHHSKNKPPNSPPEKKFKPMEDFNNPLFTKDGSFYLCRHCGRKFSSMYKVKMHATRYKNCKNPGARMLIKSSPSKSKLMASNRISSLLSERANIDTEEDADVGNSEDIHTSQSSAARTSQFSCSERMVFDIPPIKVERLDSPEKNSPDSDWLESGESNFGSNSTHVASVEKTANDMSDQRTINGPKNVSVPLESDQHSKIVISTLPFNSSLLKSSNYNSTTNEELNLVQVKVENEDRLAPDDHLRHSENADISAAQDKAGCKSKSTKTKPQPVVDPLCNSSKQLKNISQLASIQFGGGASRFQVPHPRASLQKIIPINLGIQKVACDTSSSQLSGKLFSDKTNNMYSSSLQSSSNNADNSAKMALSKNCERSTSSKMRSNTETQHTILPKPFLGANEVNSPTKKWMKEAEKFCMSKSQENNPNRGLVLKVPLIRLQRLNLINYEDSDKNQGKIRYDGLLQSTPSTSVASNENKVLKTNTSEKSRNAVNNDPVVEPKEEQKDQVERPEETICGW